MPSATYNGLELKPTACLVHRLHGVPTKTRQTSPRDVKPLAFLSRRVAAEKKPKFTTGERHPTQTAAVSKRTFVFQLKSSVPPCHHSSCLLIFFLVLHEYSRTVVSEYVSRDTGKMYQPQNVKRSSDWCLVALHGGTD